MDRRTFRKYDSCRGSKVWGENPASRRSCAAVPKGGRRMSSYPRALCRWIVLV